MYKYIEIKEHGKKTISQRIDITDMSEKEADILFEKIHYETNSDYFNYERIESVEKLDVF